MDELQELIDKFWLKKLTPKEQVKLSELLNRDTSTLKHKLEDEYKTDVINEPDEVVEKHFREILKQLHTRIEVAEQSSATKIVSLYQPMKWIAALLILSLGTGIWFLRKDEAPAQVVASQPVAKTLRLLEQVFNTGKEEMVLKLSDGSVVTLQPGSSLSYYKPFVNIYRSISLNGEATFTVAKDKLHPFIVTAQGFTTTALGTKFIVNTKLPDQILIKLLEGKVVIKSDQGSGMSMKDVYLSAGRQLSIDTRLKQSAISSFIKVREGQLPKTYAQPKVALLFKEDTLTNVFNQLSAQYKIKITYDGITPEEMRRLFFTGTFDPSETLDGILPAICNMNDLEFKRTADTVIISKKK